MRHCIMNERLALLINSYLVVTATAQARIRAFGISIPMSKSDWQSSNVPAFAQLEEDITFEKHDYGCTVTFVPGTIKIEFNEAGKGNGVRLENLPSFAGNAVTDYGFKDADELAIAFRSAVADGGLMMGDDGLAYLSPEYSYIDIP